MGFVNSFLEVELEAFGLVGLENLNKFICLDFLLLLSQFRLLLLFDQLQQAVGPSFWHGVCCLLDGWCLDGNFLGSVFHLHSTLFNDPQQLLFVLLLLSLLLNRLLFGLDFFNRLFWGLNSRGFSLLCPSTYQGHYLA